jgi:hypothetical protein
LRSGIAGQKAIENIKESRGENMREKGHEHGEGEMGMGLVFREKCHKSHWGHCDRLSFSLGSPKSGVGHGIAFPRRVSPLFLTLFWSWKGKEYDIEICDK